ncbi:hypothetical protein LPW26_11235 [Rhodopseudomonas sp. HC1]|uniref:hypothetical protein n=1 Tax=Rhodopseudomonas infernalis TaxID=2897386 RepID=UPI001EE85A91|nr:hypothetical protein [Rhodopseudomonas infernalis]MCG6205215.1 hypothetical protein [Rhodopseudomonas infernalis]
MSKVGGELAARLCSIMPPLPCRPDRIPLSEINKQIANTLLLIPRTDSRDRSQRVSTSIANGGDAAPPDIPSDDTLRRSAARARQTAVTRWQTPPCASAAPPGLGDNTPSVIFAGSAECYGQPLHYPSKPLHLINF